MAFHPYQQPFERTGPETSVSAERRRGSSMTAMSRFSSHVNGRLAELRQMKQKGAKIIGYIPNGYMPEELVYACEAIPLALGRGGDSSAVEASVSTLGRYLDPYCRAQIGYFLLKEDPFYQMLDLLVVPITDTHMRAIADSWEFFSDVDIFRLGVPHAKTNQGFKYYSEGICLLKRKLEQMTGTKITEQKLQDEIDTSNKIKTLLKEISLMRKLGRPPINGKDFVKLIHNSFFAERRVLIDILERLCQELEKSENSSKYFGPRIMFTGSTLAAGDYYVLDLLEKAGASIVIEEFCEGLREYWHRIDIDGNPIQALAKNYFAVRVPCAFFRGSSKERYDLLQKLIKEFRVDGIVWYSLMYRESYEIEAYLFRRLLADIGIPILYVKSHYASAEKGPLKTRLEAFIEIIAGRQSNGS
jgi:benzoyl-CoA reductase/2-hydroxyglutaryl-CoA dehydratase subunit BcrC/BadD/HgdB